MIVRISINFLEESQSFVHFFFFSAGQKEDVSLHTVDIDPWNDLNFRIGSFSSLKVFFTVMFAGVKFYGLIILGKMLLFEVVVAGNEIVEFLHVLDSELNA